MQSLVFEFTININCISVVNDDSSYDFVNVVYSSQIKIVTYEQKYPNEKKRIETKRIPAAASYSCKPLVFALFRFNFCRFSFGICIRDKKSCIRRRLKWSRIRNVHLIYFKNVCRYNIRTCIRQIHLHLNVGYLNQIYAIYYGNIWEIANIRWIYPKKDIGIYLF